jgi:3-oxoacyl-(acyl-carrier-protein) synthase
MRQAIAASKHHRLHQRARHFDAVGDVTEIGAMREVFGNRMPPVNSTKSLTGHSLGAAGVHEAIYSILQMQSGFIAESANIEEIDPEVADAPSCAIASTTRNSKP